MRETSRLTNDIRLKITLSLLLGISLIILAYLIGLTTHSIKTITPVILPSIFLEVIFGAAASIPFGFNPVSGALIASLSNIAFAPFLIVAFDTVIKKWNWLGNHLKKADSISLKYGKFGLFSLIFLVPFIGVYVGVAVGVALRLRPILIFTSLSIGVFVSGFLTTFIGNGIIRLF